jgi:hypothetical protein
VSTGIAPEPLHVRSTSPKHSADCIAHGPASGSGPGVSLPDPSTGVLWFVENEHAMIAPHAIAPTRKATRTRRF